MLSGIGKVLRNVLKTRNSFLNTSKLKTVPPHSWVEKELSSFTYMRLVNKPYENKVTLTEQNPPLKCYQHLEVFTQLKKGLDL